MRYQTLCFDYDGTIHDSMHIYFNAFIKAYDYLVTHGYQNPKAWSKEEVKVFLGQNPPEMWASFKPEIPQHIIAIVSQLIGEEMKKAILNHEAKLYEGALETLQYLKDKGYQLVYLSNSKIYYMEANKNEFKLDTYFHRFVVSEMFDFIPKKDILAHIKDELPHPILMIGDRIHDIESGLANHIDTVACLYGYGQEKEFVGATYQIRDIRELKNIL
ncbi:MAG: HAD family hydrolase [Bacilli bacterium]